MTREHDRTERQAAYVAAHRKSQIVGLLLTFFFGPLGLLYSRAWVLAILLAALAVIGLGTIIVPIAIWITSMITGFYAVSRYNKRLQVHVDLVAS